MHTVLSTKKLEPHHVNLLLNKGIALVEYNAIKIDLLGFEISSPVENAIITSKNAARAIIRQKVSITNCFCVGEKTSAFLKDRGYNVVEIQHYGAALAREIVERYSTEKFTFFCGDNRREELPSILKEKLIELQEIVVYKSRLAPRKFQQEFDGILFFSPSAVKSHQENNDLKETLAFCIGDTTAGEARKYTDRIIIANKPSIENVLVQVIKTFQYD